MIQKKHGFRVQGAVQKSRAVYIAFDAGPNNEHIKYYEIISFMWNTHNTFSYAIRQLTI